MKPKIIQLLFIGCVSQGMHGLYSRNTFHETFNQLQIGFNFLYPKDWWQQFCQLNVNALSLNDLNYPLEGHITTLCNFQLLTYDPQQIQTHIANLTQQSSNGAKNINQKFKSVASKSYLHQFPHKINQRVKQNTILTIPHIQSHPFSKILICPQINCSFSQEMDIQWIIVNPAIAFKIMEHEAQKLNNVNWLVGLPVFNMHKTKEPTKYKPKHQLLTHIGFFNENYPNFAVVGFIDRNLSVSDLLDHFYAILEHQITQKQHRSRNQLIINNSNFYYDFQQPYFTLIAQRQSWEDIQSIQMSPIHTLIKRNFVVFNSYLTQKDLDVVLDKQKYHVADIFDFKIKGNKKLKIDTTTQTHQKGFTRFGKGQYEPMITEDRPADHIDLCPSTTEGDTRSQCQLEDYIAKRFCPINQYRIDHQLWKSKPNINNFRKLVQTKMNHLIHFPSKTTERVFILQECKKIYFDKTRSQLIFNINTEMLEELQPKEQMIDQQKIPTSTLTYLDRLAHSLSQKQVDLMRLQKVSKDESEIDEQSNLQVKTCKHADNLDEEQSRQID